MTKSSPQARSGFSLTELVILLVVLTALGAFAMPKLYRPRPAVNEASAVDVLNMLGSAQRSHRQATGSWAELFQIQFAPGREPNDLAPFMPFFSGSDNFVNYGGYHYLELVDLNGRPAGCLATPITPGFSGRKTFRLTYADGSIEVLPADFDSTTGQPD
jgi:type II secretory pathway pseudopilin PulG